jgi:hypothetical protein
MPTRDNRRSHIRALSSTTSFRGSRPRPRVWLLGAIAVVAFALTLGPRPAVSQKSQREVKPAAEKSSELVFDRNCLEAVQPSHDFELHVPLDKNGEPVDALIYNTGKLDFKVKSPSCAKVVVQPKPAAKGTTAGEGKNTCCGSGR